ncbi:MAG TPA: N-acetylmuramoyl-L-alanine amidase [Candidatus Acidoferrum sp.]|nr:N-acetylmuramoyl-L-alanine amidase [Candidatus Acidoferrum sp.]
MKAPLLALLLLAALAGPASGGVNRLQRVSVAGADYVRVGEWADDAGLTMLWRKNQDSIELTNQSATVRLATDSHNARKSQICGVTVWLSLPVILRGGVPWISLVDVQTTLQPVLFPLKSRAPVQTICLDPGHGGADKGEVAGENFEKKYTLLLALAAEKLLQAEGFKVVLTRTNDVYVDLTERPARAAKAGADLFVSLHYNSGPQSLHGVEVHCLPPAGMKSSNAGGGRGGDPAYPGNAQDGRNILLACQVLKSITAALPLEEIGVKREHYMVLKEARIPAILVEGGFMTDPQDAKKIYDPEFRQRMARSIVNGILAYKKAVAESSPPPAPPPAGNQQVRSPARPSPAPGRD